MDTDPKKTVDYDTWLNHVARVLLIILSIAVAIGIYYWAFKDIITGRSHFIAYIVIWLFSSYIVLPRVYRFISKVFLPNYFIGRTQASDGLLGDPVNLAFDGNEKDLKAAFNAAGWTEAEPLSINSSLKMIVAAVFARHYPSAPVSSLFLFNRRQNFAFEMDLHGNPRKRHHIRFWKTPKNWWLPGGYKADWLAAATFDEHVSISLFTWQVTHKIGSNVDRERDFVVNSLQDTRTVKDLKTVKHFTSSYHSRNGGGDAMHTDGELPFVTV